MTCEGLEKCFEMIEDKIKYHPSSMNMGQYASILCEPEPRYKRDPLDDMKKAIDLLLVSLNSLSKLHPGCNAQTIDNDTA